MSAVIIRQCAAGIMCFVFKGLAKLERGKLPYGGLFYGQITCKFVTKTIRDLSRELNYADSEQYNTL